MSNVQVLVKCDDATHIYWKRTTDNDWIQLDTTPSKSTAIIQSSSSSVTFELLADPNTHYPMKYKLSATGQESSLPRSGGPTVVVASDDSKEVYFRKDESGSGWYVGYVATSSD